MDTTHTVMQFYGGGDGSDKKKLIIFEPVRIALN